ncbi:hypothetical protein PYCC9005_002069 [Savitreella phatthalungensis]
MNTAEPIGTQVLKVRFGTFTQADIDRLSVLHVTNETIFDNLGHPTYGGLYDPRMGPSMRGISCGTCHQDERHCPGHFGHIQLAQVAYHPLFLPQMFSLLRGMCMFCYKLRLARAEVDKYACRLALLERGLLYESQNLAEMEFSSKDDIQEEDEEKEKKPKAVTSADDVVRRRHAFVRDCLARAGPQQVSNSDSAVSEARRLLIKQFLSEIVGRKRCDNCAAYSPAYRKDGFAKIFQLPLAAKYKAYMDQHGRSLVNVMLQKAHYEDRVVEPGEAPGAESDENGDATSSVVMSDSESEDEATTNQRPATPSKSGRYVPSREVYLLMERLFQNEHGVMKYIYRGQAQRPDHSFLFLSSVLVPPVKYRPASHLGDQVHENAQNELLSKILVASNQVRHFASLGAAKDTPEPVRQQAERQLVEQLIMLQHRVNSLIDSNRNPDPLHQGQEHTAGIKQTLEKKEGLFRKHMMGKRVNYAARSVISPDPNIETSEIGVPPVFARKLTYPEPVTAHNYAEMRLAVINGPAVHPGATAVQNEDGTIVSLATLTQEGRTAIANQLLTPQNRTGTGLEGSRIAATNKKVFRHLRNGDMLLLNRQPTLHKPSIMAHRARVLTGEKTIRMHYANCNTYNADFDGDEMNMHFPQNEVARAEAQLIANTDNQYLVPTSGNPLRGLIQDHVVIAVWMTNKETWFTRAEYQQLLYGTLKPEDETDATAEPRILTLPPSIIKPRALWSGKQVISTLLLNLKPDGHGLNLTSKCKVAGKYWHKGSEEGEVIFKDGHMMTGILDKSQFGASAYGLVHSVYEIYGAEYAGRLLSMLGRLFTKYSQMRAFTCRMDDLRLNEEGDAQRHALLQQGQTAGLEASSAYVGTAAKDSKELRRRLEEVLRDDEKLAGLDAAMKGKMNKVTSAVIDKCLPDGLLRKFPHNHMQTMTISGAKGSNVNVSQISCLLGQQELEGRRVPTMVSGKTLPSFKPFDTSAKAGGFIAGRFLTGIKPQEYYFHCMAGREGLIDTAVKTSRSGYLQRCLMKHLEGIRVAYDGSVRDADGSLIQTAYGEDSLDIIKQKHLFEFAFSADNFRALKEKYRVDELASKQTFLDLSSDGRKLMDKARKKPHKYGPPIASHSAARQVGITSEAFHDRLDKFVAGHKFAEGLSANIFRSLMHLRYQMSLVEPGEAVGVLASQSVGEPSTQMTLNTFHFAGFGAKNVTLGIPRLREIIMTASASIKTPTMTLKLLEGVSEERADGFAKDNSRVSLAQLVDDVKVVERQDTDNKMYTLKLNLFTEQEYRDEYNITTERLAQVVAERFPRALKRAVVAELKKAGARNVVVGETSKTKEKQVASDEAAAAKAESDDDNDGGEDEGEGPDGDATNSRYHDRSRMKATYDAPDEEEEAIRKAANADVEMEGDDDDDDDSSVDLPDASDDERETPAAREQRKAAEETAGSLLSIAAAGYENITAFEFGSSCSLTLTFPLTTPKLLMVNVVEMACKATVIQEVPGIVRAFRTQAEGLDESRLVATEGVNFKAFWNASDIVSANDLYSNDIAAIGRTYGVEAMRGAIIREVSGVFAVYGIGVDRRHLSLIADYMTFDGGYRPFNRMGIESNPSPFLKMTYETTCTFLTQAALHGDTDTLQNPSANIVLGKPLGLGTSAFDILQPMVTA